MAQISCRVNDVVKKDAESALKAMGLSVSSAINMFLTKVANEKRIPFEVSAEPRYREEVLMAFQEAEDIASGKVKAKQYDTVEAMVADIMAEEYDDEV